MMLLVNKLSPNLKIWAQYTSNLCFIYLKTEIRLCNGMCSNKESDLMEIRKYRKVVIENFNNLSDNRKKGRDYVGLHKNKFYANIQIEKIKTSYKNKSNMMSNHNITVHNQNTELKPGSQSTNHIEERKPYFGTGSLSLAEQKGINDLLKDKKLLEVSDIVLNCIKGKQIPSFSTLKILSSWASQQGYSSKIQIFQEASKSFYPKLFKKQGCFEHYFCEAVFREGKHKEALSHLETIVTKYPGFKRVKETACFIMRLIPNISEEIQEKAFELVKKFIDLENQYKPAVCLWRASIMSNQYHLQNLAKQLLEEYSELMNGEERHLIEMVEEAVNDSNGDLLHLLVEINLKLEFKEPLSRALSSLLSFYCRLENISRADEVINFALEERLSISPNSMREFLNLLHKKKMPTTFSILAFIYGFEKPIQIPRKKAPQTPQVIYKF